MGKLKDRRLEFIANAVSGKTVLDVGCVDHDARQAEAEHWLHDIICRHAREVTGLDMMETEVEALNARGYNIVCGDAQTIDLEKTFDCVVAGELIEHVNNPGLLLANLRRHLVPGGMIILTTPNPFYPWRQFEILFKGKAVVNSEHVTWFCPQTLTELLRREGFEDIVVENINSTEALFGLGRLPSFFRSWFSTNLLAYAKRGAPEGAQD